MHLDRAADRRGQLAPGAFERNYDVIRPKLRIVDHLLRPAYGPERDVDAIEDLVPMRHRLRPEDLVEDRGELGHIGHQLRRLGEPRVRDEVGTADRFRHRRQLVGGDDEHEPDAVGGPVHVHRRVRRILAVVQAEELRLGQRRLDRDARRPDALRKKRGGDVRTLAGALAAIKRGDDRGVDPDRSGVVAAAGHGPGRRRAGIARHRQQAAARPVRRDVEARQIGIGPLFAEAREIGVDQARIPLRQIVILQLQSPARGMRRIDDEHVRPFDEPLDHRASAGRFQVERHAALVAVHEVPGIRVL